MSKITIKEIAEKAEVSIGTVDRVLHNRGNVLPEKIKKIKEICKKYGYESNIVGKAMAMQRKENIVAVIVNSPKRNEFSKKIYEGLKKIEEEIQDYNVKFEYFDLIDNTVSESSKILEEITNRSISGIIIKPIDSPIIKFKLNKIVANKNIPIVTVTSDIDGVEKIGFVGENHKKLGRIMANTLAKISKEDLNILVIVGSLNVRARREKLDGFINYIEEKKLNWKILDIKEVSYDENDVIFTTIESLKKWKETNAIYIHTSEFTTCLKAIREYGEYHGLTFSYGQDVLSAPYITNGELDFAIYENPYEHGYVAGNMMFEYLLNGTKIANGNHLFEGKIVFEENC